MRAQKNNGETSLFGEKPLLLLCSNTPRRSIGGSILLVVLVTLLFASIALTLFIEKACDDLLIESRAVAAQRLRLEAYSALETTLAVLQDFRLANGGLRSPSEGWNDPLEWAGYVPGGNREITVEFVDESGKLSLPQMTQPLLQQLFKSWNIFDSDAARLADALMQWMKEDYVATSGISPDYENDPLPYVAPGRPLRSFTELAAIDEIREMFFDENGRPNERWKRFTQSVSLLSFAQSNINSASPDALAALGFDITQQERIGNYLAGTGSYTGRGPGFFQSAGEASTLLALGKTPASLGATINALRIIVTVREGRLTYRLNAVVATSNNSAQAITQKATTKRTGIVINNTQAKAQETSDKNAQTSASKTNAKDNSTTTPSLNYPFTLLEIKENDEMPQPAAEPPPTDTSTKPINQT